MIEFMLFITFLGMAAAGFSVYDRIPTARYNVEVRLIQVGCAVMFVLLTGFAALFSRSLLLFDGRVLF